MNNSLVNRFSNLNRFQHLAWYLDQADFDWDTVIFLDESSI